MLNIKNVTIAVETKQLLHNISFSIDAGKVHMLIGSNGSGKSTLAYALMGHPRYSVINGSFYFNEKNITQFSTEQRAREGMFLALQQPVMLPGVSVYTLLKEAWRVRSESLFSLTVFDERILAKARLLELDETMLHRPLDSGFSGGQKKKLEMLQLLVLRPKCAIIDEIDAGLDSDAFRCIGKALQKLREENPQVALLVISHNERMLEFLKPDAVHVMIDGRIVQTGDQSVMVACSRKGYHGTCR